MAELPPNIEPIEPNIKHNAAQPQKQLVQEPPKLAVEAHLETNLEANLPELPVLLPGGAAPKNAKNVRGNAAGNVHPNIQGNLQGIPQMVHRQKFILPQRGKKEAKKEAAGKRGLLVEHLRNYYSNYIPHSSAEEDQSPAHQSPAHEGAALLFEELLHNSIDEYLEGHGGVIDVLCNAETITLRDYGRGIEHDQLCAAAQEFSAKSKRNSRAVQYCEGLSGLGLKLANALSSRFLLRSYRNEKFAELQSARGLKLHERRGRCEKKAGTFIRFTPDAQIFGKQPVQAAVLAQIMAKAAALHPGLELRLNQEQVFLAKGLAGLFTLLPKWRGQNYCYAPRSLGAANWQLSFAHLAEWQQGGLQNPLWAASFVNARECTGGCDGGQHMRQLQRAFLWALLRAFPNRKEQIQAFWDEGITLFFAVRLIEPKFEDSSKRKLVGSQGELGAIIHECQQQLLGLLQQDAELRHALEKLLDERSAFDARDEYKRRQQQLSGELLQIENQVQTLDRALDGQQKRSSELEGNLQTALRDAQVRQEGWEGSAKQIQQGIEAAANELNALQQQQHAEQARYREEWQQRLQNLEAEQNACDELKEELQQQAANQLENERQRQKLVESGLANWEHLEQALQAAGELQKQRDQEQEQLLEYLHSASEAVEAKRQDAEQNIELAEQKMLLRQEGYLENFENNAKQQFDTIQGEIAQRKQDLQTALENNRQKAYDKLEKLHRQFEENLNAQQQSWRAQLEETEEHSQAELQQIRAQREQALERHEQLWQKQEAAIAEQNQKQQQFLERSQERLDESRREAQAHQSVQYELVQNRRELEQFFAQQRSARGEQAQKWQEQLAQNQKKLDENQQKIGAQLDGQQEVQQAQKLEWEQQNRKAKTRNG